MKVYAVIGHGFIGAFSARTRSQARIAAVKKGMDVKNVVEIELDDDSTTERVRQALEQGPDETIYLGTKPRRTKFWGFTN